MLRHGLFKLRAPGQGPVSQKVLFRRTRLVNAMKGSAANFVHQIHIINSLVKLAPGGIIGISFRFSST